MSHVARSALIIAIFIGLEKLLGFLRQVLIARQFGLSAELDAFNAANNLPDILFALISGGALAIAFIPVLSEYLEKKGRTAMWEVFSLTVNLLFLVTASLALIFAVFAPQLVGVRLGVAPGFGLEQQALVVDLMRLNLISTLLFSVAGMLIAGLQANQHFFLPALARSMYDIGTLVGVIILAPKTGYTIGPITLPAFGLGVYGLVYGTILGALLFLCIQIPGLIRYKFHWTPLVKLRHPGVIKVLRLMIPRVGSALAIYLALVYIPDNIASGLREGSITALVYGWLFMQVPETLVGTALATALLPTISEQTVRGEKGLFQRSLNHSLRVLLAFSLPAASLVAIALPPVVSILGFDSGGSDLVLWTARAFLIGLLGHSLLEISARAFYAQQDAITPLWASGAMVITFTLLANLLARPLGAAGIALANALSFSGQALLLWILLNRKYPGVILPGSTLLRALAGTAIAILLAIGLTQFLGDSLIPNLAAIGLGGAATLPFIRPEIKLLMKL